MKAKISLKMISFISCSFLLANCAQANEGLMTTIDTYFPFAWMEDACIGDGLAYSSIKASNEEFNDSIIGTRDTPIVNDYDDGYEFFVKPRSLWALDFNKIVEDINIDINSEYTEYYVKFKDNVSYRGEPLTEYHYKFRPESEGGEHVLRFSNKANTDEVWTSFIGRQTENWDGYMHESKAKYNRQNKTITCYF